MPRMNLDLRKLSDDGLDFLVKYIFLVIKKKNPADFDPDELRAFYEQSKESIKNRGAQIVMKGGYPDLGATTQIYVIIWDDLLYDREKPLTFKVTVLTRNAKNGHDDLARGKFEMVETKNLRYCGVFYGGNIVGGRATTGGSSFDTRIHEGFVDLGRLINASILSGEPVSARRTA